MSEETKTPPPYIDDLTIREAYVETVQVIPLAAGAVRIEFCVNRYSTTAPVRITSVVPVARLAMHPALAMMLRDQITNSIEHMRQAAELAQAPAASERKQ